MAGNLLVAFVFAVEDAQRIAATQPLLALMGQVLAVGWK